MKRKRALAETITRTLARLGIEPGATVIVACSGGTDSVALAHAIWCFGLHELVLAHVEHGIREKDSREEECRVVDALGRLIGVRVLRRSVPPDFVYRKAREEKRSLEEVARRLRYQFLFEIALEISDDGHVPVLTAHHARDLTETFLMRAFTGRSPLELSGIPEERVLHIRDVSVRVLRPLLDVARRDLEEHVASNRLPVIHDPSNRDTRFLRNRIRQVLLPALESVFPGVIRSGIIERFVNDLIGLREGLRELIPADAWGEYGEESWRVKRSRFEPLPRSAKELVLREAVYRYTADTRVSFRPFRNALDERRDLCSAGITLHWGEESVSLRRDVVRYGTRGYLWSVGCVADVRIRSFDGRVILRERVSGGGDEPESVRWSVGPLSPPVIIRPRRDGDRVLYQGEVREVRGLLKRSESPPQIRRIAPVLEDSEGIVAILGDTGPICTRDGVQYSRETKTRRRGSLSLSVQYEEIFEYAEWE